MIQTMSQIMMITNGSQIMNEKTPIIHLSHNKKISRHQILAIKPLDYQYDFIMTWRGLVGEYAGKKRKYSTDRLITSVDWLLTQANVEVLETNCREYQASRIAKESLNISRHGILLLLFLSHYY